MIHPNRNGLNFFNNFLWLRHLKKKINEEQWWQIPLSVSCWGWWWWNLWSVFAHRSRVNSRHTLVNNLMIKFLTIKFYNPYNRFNVVLIDDRPRIQQHYTIKSISSFYSSKLNHMKSSNIMNIYQVSLASRWYTSFDSSFEKIFWK